MSGGYGRCPHCGAYQVMPDKSDGDIFCLTCGYRKSANTLTQAQVLDPRVSYPVRLRRFVA